MPVDMRLFKDLIQRYEWPKAIAVTGALGSGKTEWVLNLALGLKTTEEKVTIADADIINPYFCIRQVVTALEKKGFTVLTAPGQAKWADMPVVSAEVDWALSSPGKLMIDIGGDAEGALALKQFQKRIIQAGYLLVLVVNAFRPQTCTVEKIELMCRRMEEICGLKVGALISNSHLMNETTVETVTEGYQLVQNAARRMGLPLLYVGTSPELYDDTVRALAGERVPVWPVSRYMLLPWEPGAIWATGIPARHHAGRIFREKGQSPFQNLGRGIPPENF
ncbi:hypothetical protein RAH42_05660 [Pyramidobacter sp. YE332]|uniref:hypothetical protein n=1 Tax=unclassified Pyramidobacter TaxID=2632171 RepID=UPI00098F796F|nr:MULTISPECIES: hypothetical protein [unclassified Pyramidobacter]OON87788.1 hypothetical protein B0D78_09705 [Pyramidobacter sp. C12-8]WOL41126.1 hypothetical protein RAH42_05660 [Pyramidobacter sp. YE332]